MKQYDSEKPILERILKNINNIEDLLKTTTEGSFMSDLKDFNAICLEIIQIGEKVNQVPWNFMMHILRFHSMNYMACGIESCMAMKKSIRLSSGQLLCRISWQ